MEEYWPWVGGICKCLGANARGFPGVNPPGMAADKCIAAVEKHNEYQKKYRVLSYLKENKLGRTDPCTCNLFQKYIYLIVPVCLFVNGNNSI